MLIIIFIVCISSHFYVKIARWDTRKSRHAYRKSVT